MSAARLQQTYANCSPDAHPKRGNAQDKHGYDNCQLSMIVVAILQSIAGNEINFLAVNYGDYSTKRSGYDGKSHVNISLKNMREYANKTKRNSLTHQLLINSYNPDWTSKLIPFFTIQEQEEPLIQAFWGGGQGLREGGML